MAEIVRLNIDIAVDGNVADLLAFAQQERNLVRLAGFFNHAMVPDSVETVKKVTTLGGSAHTHKPGCLTCLEHASEAVSAPIDA